MVPSIDNTKVATALGLLTSVYSGKPAIQGVLTSLANRFQLLEQQIWSVINAYILANFPQTGSYTTWLVTALGSGGPTLQYLGGAGAWPPGAVIPAGSVLQCSSTGDKFTTSASFTLPAIGGSNTVSGSGSVRVNDIFYLANNWVALDNLGAIVGEARQGRTDPAYLPAILLRILVNKSTGSTSDIIAIVRNALSALGTLPILLSYWEPAPGEFEFDIVPLATTTLNALLSLLPEARAGGYQGMLVSSSASIAETITWGSVGFGGGASFASNRRS